MKFEIRKFNFTNWVIPI